MGGGEVEIVGGGGRGGGVRRAGLGQGFGERKRNILLF